MRILVLISLLLLARLCPAAEWQSLPAIQSAVESFLQEKTAHLPGERTITVNPVEPRLKLSQCERLEPYLPNGAQLAGNTSVGVRCLAPKAWSLFVPATIRVSAQVLVALRAIPAGQFVQAEDIARQQRDITAFAGAALTREDQALGKRANLPIAAGAALRSEWLRAPYVVLQGQQVKLIARGSNFQVAAEGTAMANAAAGQVVGVRTPAGQVIKGVAKSEGVVEVTF